MADQLARVRSKFVSNVGKEVINQLLDDLLEDNVLNEGEKDSVLEENNSRADKARSLIDSVKKKGDPASNKMITHLYNRDPTLFINLNLTLSQPVMTLSHPVQQTGGELQWPTSLTPATDGFYQMKSRDISVYPVSRESIKTRVALLITNIDFADKRRNRNGADTDEKNMEKLLRDLGYEVVKRTNLTAKQIDAALRDFSKHPKLKETDSVFVVIMSHGYLGVILDVNNDEFQVDNIYKHLGSVNCPALIDKPKVIIIQACRGSQSGAACVAADGACSNVVSDSGSQDENVDDDCLKYVHKEKDFISLLSSTPHTVGYRDKIKGSFLIQFIVEVFNTHSHDTHIEELFMRVMQRFEALEISHNRRQMPTKDRCTLTKHLYLFPGH